MFFKTEELSDTVVSPSLTLDFAIPVGKSSTYTIFSRTIDLLLCSLALLPLAFVLVSTWLINLLSSPGPLFYWQTRVGLNGTEFKILKLRSMKVDAEKGGAVWAKENDPRITWIGKWLRMTHLDELPQIYNVFLGQMSIIGPRPERPEFTKLLLDELPNYQFRYLMKPGVTGWAQIHQMYSASVEESSSKLDYDLYYLIHRNWMLDIYILVRTLVLVLNLRGR